MDPYRQWKHDIPLKLFFIRGKDGFYRTDRPIMHVVSQRILSGYVACVNCRKKPYLPLNVHVIKLDIIAGQIKCVFISCDIASAISTDNSVRRKISNVGVDSSVSVVWKGIQIKIIFLEN